MIWVVAILLIGIGIGYVFFKNIKKKSDKLYAFNVRKIEEAKKKVIGIKRSLTKQRKIVERILRKE